MGLIGVICLQDSQSQAQPDELIDFHHLKARRGMSQLEIEDQVQTDLQRATGLAETGSENAARLNRVLQLTGGSSALLPASACHGTRVPCSKLVRSWVSLTFSVQGIHIYILYIYCLACTSPRACLPAVCASHDEAHEYTCLCRITEYPTHSMHCGALQTQCVSKSSV